MKQVRRLAKETSTTSSDNNVDVIYQNNEVVFFLRTLHKSERLNAPMNWCHQNNVTEKSNSSQIIHKVQQCFEAIAISDSARKAIAATLRLIRDAFRNESVPLVMTYGSLLGSLRYHARMPFDCDYDMAVPFSKWAHVRRIFLRLASEPANQMRMIDFRAVTGCMQIGIACGRNESWRDPTSWGSFNGTMTFQDGVPVGHGWLPYKTLMGACMSYMDIYPKADNDPHLLALSDGVTSYRPIEGTLFRTLTTPIRFLENTYDSSLNVCVPKYSYLHKGSFHHLPQDCTGMRVPCSWLDSTYPRVYAFSAPDNDFTYEVGLESYQNRSCWIHSIYYYRK
ncbi:conserved hypothetical protein [Echinococcus multilocularis]|uniref:Lipopolysaccharide choline n=1 Tax=Echinococcus multilocularis TaxID=6211 RepID=A0A068Y140_ECHMU|nr:conserved hypothetical protein [Echinococcus multilocularis]